MRTMCIYGDYSICNYRKRRYALSHLAFAKWLLQEVLISRNLYAGSLCALVIKMNFLLLNILFSLGQTYNIKIKTDEKNKNKNR